MRLRTALLTAAALLTLSTSALAENRLRMIDEERELYRATFEGGTLAEFIEMLDDGLDGKVMFITPERASEIRMPKLDVANVEFPQIISLTGTIVNVPSRMVNSDEWAGMFETGEGVPIIAFDTSRVFVPEPTREIIQTLDFPGGTVQEYVEALKHAGAEGRVVITGESGTMPMQPVTLRNVQIESAIRILDGIESDSGANARRVTIESLGNLYRVHIESRRRSAETVSRVWSLRAITANGMKDDTLLSAIEAGIDTLGEGRAPNLRYHEPTALLIAVGDPVALKLIESIIDGLDESARIGAITTTPIDGMRQHLESLKRAYARKEVSLTDTRNRAELLEREIMAAHDEIAALEEAEAFSRPAAVMIERASQLKAEADSIRAQSASRQTELNELAVLIEQLESLIEAAESGEAEPLSGLTLMQEFSVR